MKTPARSSITLPPEELRLVEQLRRRTRSKSKVAVVRRALHLLDEVTSREQLRKSYQDAALAVRESTQRELDELDELTSEGLDD